jgi:hypothetical protein
MFGARAEGPEGDGAMVAELKTFKRDWQRWSPAERRAARVLAVLVSSGILGQFLLLVA